MPTQTRPLPAIRPVPHHQVGSAHYYSLGCRCKSCRESATGNQRTFRTTRYRERELRDGRYYHPALAPAGTTDRPAHGSSYGYFSLGCRCDDCRSIRNRRSGPILGWTGLAVGIPIFAQAMQWLAIAFAVVAVAMWLRGTVNPLHVAMAGHARVASKLTLGAGIANSAIAAVISVFARSKGKHRTDRRHPAGHYTFQPR